MTIHQDVKPLVAECDYPWAVQVACTLLHRSTAHVVRRYIFNLLKAYPSPAELAKAKQTDIEPIIAGGGFQNRKASTLILQAQHFAAGESVETCPGLNKYSMEAYRIFVLGDLSFEPEDRSLRIWRSKLKN